MIPIFGFWESILSFLIRMVGLRTDVADAAGSLHAKVKDVRDKIGTSADTRASNTVMGWQATQVKSWQRVVFTPTASPYNVAITSVNTAKCIFIVNGAAGVILSDGVNYTGSCNSDYCISEVSSTAITIICSIVPGGTDRLMRYGSGSLQVIEFY